MFQYLQFVFDFIAAGLMGIGAIGVLVFLFAGACVGTWEFGKWLGQVSRTWLS